MKKKTVVRIMAGLGGVFILLFSVLCVHLYAIAKRTNENPNNKIQLSRIDFKQPVDSMEAIRMKNYVITLNGVQGAHFNTAHGTLVYGYTLGTQTPQEVYTKIMDFSEHKYKAEPYVVSADQLNRGCPAGFDNSMTMQFSNFLYKTFN
jgi:hypothetical protein